MGTRDKKRLSIHHRDQFPQFYIRNEDPGDAKIHSTISFATPLSSRGDNEDQEEVNKATFEKLYKFLSPNDEFREASSIPFATSPALLGSHRK